MNKTFTLVWSAARSAFIVAHEHAKSHGKPSSTCKSAATAAVLLGLLGSGGYALAGPPVVPPVNALPTGGQVAAGAASITQSANRMDINQSTQKAILNWSSFNIGANAQVNFAQPNASAVALNRVLSSDPSAIYGKLSANGQVFLLNPNGVLFGAGARVDVGGLVASTMKIDDADFMAGNYRFSGGSGSVINQGNLTAAQGGYIALLSPEVRNEGVISASLGTVVLGGAEAVTLSVDATGLSYAVDKGAVQALVENKGLVQADGGQVILSARSANELASAVINNSGTIEAKGLVSKGGKIVLEGDHITLASGSTLDASGTTGGGTVLVGGDWQGSGTLHQATTVTMEQGAKIDVSATHSGSGGKAVLWSDITQGGSVTRVDGEILAKGGSEGGDGGKVETSGHTLNIGEHTRVSASATHGVSGEWLLDPTNFTIVAGGAAQTTSGIGASTIENTLSATGGNTNLTITTSATANGSDLGDIIIDTPLAWSANTLSLSAHRHVLVNSVVGVAGTGALTVTTNTSGATNQVGTGTSTGTRAGYLKFKQNRNGLTGTDTFDGQLNWTSSGALTINSATYTIVSAVSGTAGTDLVELANGTGHYALAGNLDLSNAVWTPLDNFGGTIEGLGHTISNFSITTTGNTEPAGFIKRANIGTTLQNIGLVNAQVVGDSNVGTGAFIGKITMTGGTVNLRNLFVDATSTVTSSVTGKGNFGGLVGSINSTATDAVNVIDGYNAAKIYATVGDVSFIGGVIGEIDSGGAAGRQFFLNLMDVYNVGEIMGGTLASKNAGNFAGGITPRIIIRAPGGAIQLENLRNYGDIFSGSYVGGVAGELQSNGTSALAGPVDAHLITNYGAISGAGNNGGIFGYATAAASDGSAQRVVTLSGVTNKGVVTSTGAYAGGIIGFAYAGYGHELRLVNVVNEASISGTNNVGGLIGDVRHSSGLTPPAESEYSTVKITDAVNSGAVYGSATDLAPEKRTA